MRNDTKKLDRCEIWFVFNRVFHGEISNVTYNNYAIIRTKRKKTLYISASQSMDATDTIIYDVGCYDRKSLVCKIS